MSFPWSFLPLSWSLKIFKCNRSSLVANSSQLHFMMFYRISDSSNLSFNILLNFLDTSRKKFFLGLFLFQVVVLLYSTKVFILLACSQECWCQHWWCNLEHILQVQALFLCFFSKSHDEKFSYLMWNNLCVLATKQLKIDNHYI